MGSYSLQDYSFVTIVCVLLFEEEQKTQWPSEKVQKDKRATTHTHKTKVRVTRTTLKTGDELRCSGRVSSSCSTSC
jgi:hypothetical protein